MVQQLTGLDSSNASLLDEASAGGQAFYMAYNINNGQKNKFFVDSRVFPATCSVVKTRAKHINAQIVVGNYQQFIKNNKIQQFCGVMVQSPDINGTIHDFTSFFNQLKQKQSQLVKIVASDLMAMTISKSAGSMGSDICFGSAQRLGVPMGFGGPSAGFFATQRSYIRKMPGRIIGISIDSSKNPAYRMALQTRQQHIRRQKATSNICTAQALLANISAMYAIWHGASGLRQISFRICSITQAVQNIFEAYGFQVFNKNNQYCNYFDTITIKNCNSAALSNAFLEQQINIRIIDQKTVSLSFNQLSSRQDLQIINKVLSKFTNKNIQNLQSFINKQAKQYHKDIIRQNNFMKQQIFNKIHSQSQMMRYLRYLQQKDISLDRSMIPLGSCTMKLNAATQMIPLTWPQMNIHPYTPKNQTEGYLTMINQLGRWLSNITGFDGVCFQPNSGATGQYAGLLTIVKYLQSIGQGHRDICLIPKSAHGTNPASAILAGLKVIPVQCNDGRIQVSDLKAKCQQYGDKIAAVMVTFPSTAGIYQSTIHQIIQSVHKVGGQVYMDGANMNAQVGFTSPGYLGADVCHLNLHKTFAIPHGGGGPGMGPIGVRKHLLPFLPGHPMGNNLSTNSGTIGAAQYGSASILSISYAYIALLGKQGIRKSTAYAILNANYLMQKLRQHYPIMYNPKRCSHEFILDVTGLKKKHQVTQQDIAKRLMDYGFHAPTMSFPVPGCLMIQPTQSEDKGQLDRFADALINIKKQIQTIPEVVRNAPYTASILLTQPWPFKTFTPIQAAYPLPWVKSRGKFWPSVGRISNPYGDKNLICSCPDISSYVQ